MPPSTRILVCGRAGKLQAKLEAEKGKRDRADLPFAVIHVCIQKEGDPLERLIEDIGFVREQDVLDTWFSSALWPQSTFGWPEKTDDLN